MLNIARKEKRSNFKSNEEKWTSVLMKAGYTVMPSVVFERQRALGLDAIDINIILHLARHWWRKDSPPFPSKRSIAECMDIDVSTVRRRIARMERDGLIRRRYRRDPINQGQRTNEYLFDGLIKEATPYAKELIQERTQRNKVSAQRRTRKRPLKLVATAKED